MNIPSPDYSKSVEFLEWWRPGGPWVLTSISLSKSIQTRTFDLSSKEEMLRWLDSCRGTNLYFMVNPPMRDLQKKAERHDVAALQWLHVDIDPRAGEDLESERKRALAILMSPPKGVPLPSCIVFSGGGYQAFWRLSDPFTIGGDLALAEEAKRYNLQLEVLFGADRCHNVDRIMRLPGSVNWPDERKRKKGRTATLAAVVEVSDRTYSLSDFVPAPQVQGQSTGFGGGSVEPPGNVRRYELDELPATVPPVCKVVIAQGRDPDDDSKFPSRSEALFYVCCELVRNQVPDSVIYSIITDPEYGISESVLEKRGGSERYALRQIERAKEQAVHPILRELNDQFAVIGDVGGKCRVVSEVTEPLGDGRRSRISYMSFGDLKNWLCNRRVQVSTSQGTSEFPAGSWWLAHPMRRQYRTVTFAPGREVPGSFNLWKGFAFEPRPGDCSAWLEHVRENVCGGDEHVYSYLLGWCATCVQHPAQPGHTAIVLRGRQGTGKGVFATTFGSLFGRHFLPVRDSAHLLGQFNSHLRDCLVLFSDEAFWAGNKKFEGLLKSIITEREIVSEAKGIDATVVSNYIHLIVASNEDWVVPAGIDDRRFVVLDVSDGRKQDNSYFSSLQSKMESGGYEALLYYLITYDLSSFDVRKTPKTSALLEQKTYSFSSEEEWWYGKLSDGRLIEREGREDWPRQVFATELCHDFVSYARLWSSSPRSNSTRLGRFLRRAIPEHHEYRGQMSGTHDVVQLDGTVRAISRPYVYLLPTLQDCRRHWDEQFGGPYSWPRSPGVVKEVESVEHF